MWIMALLFCYNLWQTNKNNFDKVRDLYSPWWCRTTWQIVFTTMSSLSCPTLSQLLELERIGYQYVQDKAGSKVYIRLQMTRYWNIIIPKMLTVIESCKGFTFWLYREILTVFCLHLHVTKYWIGAVSEGSITLEFLTGLRPRLKVGEECLLWNFCRNLKGFRW